jgi:CBS domain-containing protein
MDRIREIMESDLITVPESTPVSELAALLDRAGITGAPVVDDEGVLLGIVTVRDVMRLAREATEVPEAARWGLGTLLKDEGVGSMDLPLEGEFYAYYVTAGGGFVDLRDRIRQLPESVFDGYTVADIMTREPVTTPSSTRIRDLARLLVDRKIHRALVVDDGKLVGIVTSTDVLRAVAEG